MLARPCVPKFIHSLSVYYFQSSLDVAVLLHVLLAPRAGMSGGSSEGATTCCRRVVTARASRANCKVRRAPAGAEPLGCVPALRSQCDCSGWWPLSVASVAVGSINVRALSALSLSRVWFYSIYTTHDVTR